MKNNIEMQEFNQDEKQEKPKQQKLTFWQKAEKFIEPEQKNLIWPQSAMFGGCRPRA